MTNATEELASLRDDIDRIDGEIADLIAERTHLAADVAEVKSSAGMDIVDSDREEAVKSHYAERFRQGDLDATNGRALAEYVIEVAIGREESIADGLP